MQYRTLGRTGLRVSLASLGTGGPSRIGRETHGDEAESIRIIRRAHELGVNFFDTAPLYRTERVLGRALEGIPRDQYILSTKFTPEDEGQVVTPEEVRGSCERSLRRLHTDVIDVFHFHGVEPQLYRETVDRLYPTAEHLREQGKIRFIGTTEFFFRDATHEMIRMALLEDLWDVIMLKSGVLNFSAERELLPVAAEKNIGVLNMASVRVKLTRPDQLEELLTDWADRGLIAKDALPKQNPLGFLAGGDVESVVAAGYKFAAEHPAISSVIIGTGSLTHLESNIAALIGPPLPAQHSARIRQLFGHLSEPA